MPATAAAPRRATAADYLALEEGAPFQLIGGALVHEPAPTPFHQRLVVKLVVHLQRFVEEHDLGSVLLAPIDVRLDDGNVYQPDVLFISSERAAIITERRIEGAPDLVVEVLSPSTGYYDLTHKRRVYAEHGVREYWLIDPLERTVTVEPNDDGRFETLASVRNDGRVASALLDGFEIDAAALFAA